MNVAVLENEFWQVGILPETGASTAYGRVKVGDQWVDVMRPTALEDYGNARKAANFIMLPWCNRIRGGVLRFKEREYRLRTESSGLASHGDVRHRAWTVISKSHQHVYLTFNSADQEDVNFPFKFSARAEYALEGRDFVWRLTLKNEDGEQMPGGFGYHPYFVRSTEQQPQILIPCESQFDLIESLATAPPIPLTNRLDFRQPRALGDDEIDDVLTGRVADAPAFIHFPAWKIGLLMNADPIYRHMQLYAPKDKPFFALEPITNVSDGFNLLARGIGESGVFTLNPGESAVGEVRLEVVATNP